MEYPDLTVCSFILLGGGIHDRNVTYNTHSLNDIQDSSIKVIN